MAVLSEIIIRSPITVANVGGFDIGGMPLEKPVNYYVVQLVDDQDGGSFSYQGRYGETLRVLALANLEEELFYRTMRQYLNSRSEPIQNGHNNAHSTGYKVTTFQEIALQRGSGASAAARGSAWMALGYLVGEYDSLPENIVKEDVVREAAKLEGHWDNIAPNMLGGYVYIVPREDGSMQLIRHEPISGHGELLVTPPFAKKSTDVLRPPVQEYRGTPRVLRDTMYATGMVFSDTGLIGITENEVVDLADGFARGAPKEVPMPYIVEGMQKMIRHIQTGYVNKVYPRVRKEPSERIIVVGENSITDETHTPARANIKGYGPYSYADFKQLQQNIRQDDGYLRISGGGPNHAIMFDMATMTDEKMQRIIAKEKRFWHGIGEDPDKLIFNVTKPAREGTKVVSFSNANQSRQVGMQITSGTLEQLLYRVA